MFGRGIACLPAYLETNIYQSYLLVMPADVLVTLYEKFGARLLEQNVRTFLQARGNVNKGIRAIILNEPGMFFAYNNGITATARKVETRMEDFGLVIGRIVDLQIVNGGQTTASLFHTRKRDKADLSQIFVQMKLSVIDSQQSEIIVPKISEYANTQNRVNAADFFSNHPFHVRMEEFSRHLWAPAQKGAQRETRWFYERVRGQYADAQSKLTLAEQRRFKVEYPKPQMFTKTDLAKFENVWDDHPKWVNLGSQKNFSQYAARICREWEESSDKFDEFYFRRAVARVIIFRATEKIVSSQPWYNGGYRANLVAYTLAVLGEITRRCQKNINFPAIWDKQNIDPVLEKAIVIISERVYEDIIRPPRGISNISEWCKKEACWKQIQLRLSVLEQLLPEEFFENLITVAHDHIKVGIISEKQKNDELVDEQQQIPTVLPVSKWQKFWRKVRESTS